MLRRIAQLAYHALMDQAIRDDARRIKAWQRREMQRKVHSR